MAIEPYRRQIGLPNTAGGGMTRIADTRSVDIGPAISGLGDALRKTFEPILADEALQRGKEEAGKVQFVRSEDGTLMLPPRNEEGGLIFAKAFDQVVEARYLTEVGSEFQSFLDNEAAQRRIGAKPYDPADYAATVDAKKTGMLEAMDPRIRPQVEEVFEREALERTRAFTNEWSGVKRRETIAGVNDKLRFYMDRLKNHRAEGTSLDEAKDRYVKPIGELITRLRDMHMVGPDEADALFMETNNLTDGIERFATGMEFLATTIVPAIEGMNEADLQLIGMWTDGVNYEGQVSGLVRSSVAVPEKVTPATLIAFAKQTFGVDPTSAARDPSHPLSIKNPDSWHNTKNGGRAIDILRIPGMTFEQYVQSYKDAGFEVVEAIDEYKTPSKHATGGHWHIALGNTRKVTAEHEVSDLKGLTFEKISDLDPSAKALLKTYITDRVQVIRAEQAAARQQAAIDAQTAKIEAALQGVATTVEGALSNGVGGNWNAKEKAYLDGVFNQSVNIANMNDPNERNKVLQFVQQKNYLPEAIFNYLDNGIRSENWQPAVELYQNLKDATMGQNGARVGDMILSELDDKTAALLQYSDELSRVGLTRPQIMANIERRRSGDGYTPTEAKAQFNALADGDKNRTYDNVKKLRLTDAFGVRSGTSLPPQLMRDFDSAYVANLEITGQPEKAMLMAVNQLKGRYVKSGLFANNVGPASLLNSYNRDAITNFFFNEKTTTGQPLLRRVAGQKHRMFGDNPSVRLAPLDSNTKGIGRYEVLVFEPNNTSNLIDRFEIDLGSELRDHVAGKNPTANIVSRADKIKAVRQERDEEVDWWRGFNKRSDLIGGKM